MLEETFDVKYKLQCRTEESKHLSLFVFSEFSKMFSIKPNVRLSSAADFISTVQLMSSGNLFVFFFPVVVLQELSEERHSPPLLSVNGPGEEKLFRSRSAEVELTVEKERVKKMLSEG